MPTLTEAHTGGVRPPAPPGPAEAISEAYRPPPRGRPQRWPERRVTTSVRLVAMDIGAYEARTHLSHLLDEVARGRHFTITKHGVPVALLAPPGPGHPAESPQATLAALREFRRGLTLGELELDALIQEGRR